MAVLLIASLDTQRKAAALAAALLQDGGRITLGDFVATLAATYADRLRLQVQVDPLTCDRMERRGRKSSLLDTVTQPAMWIRLRPRTSAAWSALCAATGLTGSGLYAAAVSSLWDEVCGPDAEIWERTRRAEAAGCAAAA
jgi:hypothetical protein